MRSYRLDLITSFHGVHPTQLRATDREGRSFIVAQGPMAIMLWLANEGTKTALEHKLSDEEIDEIAMAEAL